MGHFIIMPDGRKIRVNSAQDYKHTDPEEKPKTVKADVGELAIDPIDFLRNPKKYEIKIVAPEIQVEEQEDKKKR